MFQNLNIYLMFGLATVNNIIYFWIPMSIFFFVTYNILKYAHYIFNYYFYLVIILITFIAAIIPSDNSKIRFVAGLLMLSATYVIGDMYSASLTSILARPPKGNLKRL